MADVNVADHTERLQALEVAVHRGALEARAARCPRRDRPVGGEQRLEHPRRRRGHAVAGLAQRREDLLDAGEGQRAALGAVVTAA